jgi:glucose/galactose transporter
MIIFSALYFIFGLVSWVNAILIPYFKFTCEISEVQSYLVTFAFYIAYLLFSIPSSVILNKYGYKKGLTLGLWIMSIGAISFVPAANLRSYPIFLTGLFLLGIGLTLLQSAANPFVTMLGKKESAASRISTVGFFNKLAGILSNLLFAALIIGASSKTLMADIKNGVYVGIFREQALDQLIKAVIMPYLCLAIILLIFGIIIKYSSIPDIDTSKQNSSIKANEGKSILKYPSLILGVFAMFFHVGSQMITLATVINYAGTLGFELEGVAKNFPSITMALTMVGYLIGVFFIPKQLSQRTALILSVSLNLVLSFLIPVVHYQINIFGIDASISIWFLMLMGLPNALIYAGIWPLAINGLGKLTNLGSSMLVMGLCGSAIIPLIYSMISVKTSMQTAYWILVPCFMYLLFYALKGYKINSWKFTRQ